MSFIVHRVAKHAARYIDGGGREKCGLCRFFVAPRACGKVIGPVSPMGWCKHYSRQMISQFGGSVVAGGPSLLLDFMSPGALDPRVTFTRASAATYFDSAGVMRSAAINAPRWDYAGGVLRGLLIEEQRTNLTLSSTMVGAVAGTPGTDPTGWNLDNGATSRGLIKQIVGVGTTNGIPYIDVRYFGTATAGNFFPITAGSSATTVGTAWNVSAYMALVGGSLTNVASIYLAANFDVTGNVAIDVKSILTSTLTRFTATATAPASNTGVNALFYNIPITAGPVDFTLRIAAPQLEQGAFPTSYIPTTGAAATRAADFATMPTNVSWYSQTTGTFAAEFIMLGTGVSAYPRILGDNANSNAFLYLDAGNHLGAFDGGVVSATTNTTTFGTVSKGASVAPTGAGPSKYILNGGPVASHAMTIGMGTSLTIKLMGDNTQADATTGYIRRVQYWSRVLSDTEMQQVTT